MAFGNPYGDKWDPGIVEEWAGYLYELGLRVIPLSDILGNVTPETITKVYSRIIRTFPGGGIRHSPAFAGREKNMTRSTRPGKRASGASTALPAVLAAVPWPMTISSGTSTHLL